jgi:DNA-binding response OmpR family regulator
MAKILVIDDDAPNRDILRTRLESAGYEVAEARDGEEGVTMTESLTPDLIIMDVMMPKVDGRLACRVLKSNARTKNIPLIMLTALNQEMEELRGWESGADEYLTKPCDHQRLLALISQFLAQAPKERP